MWIAPFARPHSGRVPEHIVVPLPSEPKTAPMGQLAPLTLQRLDPFRRLWRAQDSQPGQSRRVLAEYALSGSLEWAVPQGYTNPESGAVSYPLESVWREVGTFRAHLTAGCMLEAHVMYCPAGLVQRPAGLNYQSAGAWAELRVGVTWTNGASSTGPHYWTLSMPGSIYGPYGGAQNSSPGADWADLEERLIEAIRPPGSDDDDDLAATYSEWSDVEITLEVRGGERIVHATVYEVPDRHVHLHDDSGPQTVHGAPASNVPFPASARTDAPDVGVYENHRQGTVRTMQTAQRQGERLGPHIVSWAPSLHDESFSSTRRLVVAGNSAFEDIVDTSFEGWDPSYPGWVVAASTAQLHRLHGVEVRGNVAMVPVTVWADVGRPSAAPGDAVLRLQSGVYEWIDVTVPAAEGRTLITTYGYLESQVHGDHAAANLVMQASVTGPDLHVYGVSVGFGHF